MIVPTRSPDLPPRPETAANAAFRRRFFARWGQEDSVFLASTRAAEYGPLPTALSFKAVPDGQVSVRVGARRLTMGPGDALLVNPGQTYGFSIRSAEPVRRSSVQVRDELAHELAADARQTLSAALDGPRPERGVEVADRLRELDGPLRAALLRRVGWAEDFLRSHHTQAVGLADVAAHLSRFHLLRAFRQVHRCTPHQFLKQLRLRSAQRLLDDPALDLQTIAARSGFGSRWSLQRALRSHPAPAGLAWRARGRG